MMEAARSLGLAARFVSGYIFLPGMGAEGTVGGGATHAWMQAYLPCTGWIDFDPTNSIVGNRILFVLSSRGISSRFCSCGAHFVVRLHPSLPWT